jgi:hypothetical protein
VRSHPHSAPDQGASRQTPFWVTRTGARRALVAVHAAAVLAVVTELIHPFSEDDHGIERVRALEFAASYAIYGFFACVVLVLLGRLLRRLVMRRESYYGENR